MNDIKKWCTDKGIKSPYLEFAKNVYTQNGEDGIIEKLFSDLKITAGTVVEFGAWDGIFISNVYRLWRYKKLNALLIEGDAEKAGELKKISNKYANVHSLEAFVSPDRNSATCLDNIFKQSALDFTDDNFQLLSIDIDSFDYQIWDSLKEFNPKIVICETNYNYTDTEQVGDNGCSLKSLIKLAESKGYVLVCYNLNGIFVRKDLIANLIDLDSSFENMYIDATDVDNVLQRVDDNGNFTPSYRYLSDDYKALMEKEKANL